MPSDWGLLLVCRNYLLGSMHNLEQSLAKLQKKIGCCLKRMSEAAAGLSENAPGMAWGSQNNDSNRGTASWGFLVLKSVTPLKREGKRKSHKRHSCQWNRSRSIFKNCGLAAGLWAHGVKLHLGAEKRGRNGPGSRPEFPPGLRTRGHSPGPVPRPGHSKRGGEEDPVGCHCSGWNS